jgi:hypothetical protein
MKNNIKNNAMMLSIILLFMVGKTMAQSAKTDLTGAWKINMAKSDLGKTPVATAAPTTMDITQSDESIEFKRSFPGMTATETFPFDGQAVESTIPPRNDHKTSSVKWSDDKNTIIVSQKYKVAKEGKDPWEWSRTEKYYLSDNGKTLILERVSVLPDRTETVKAVYDKM